MSKPNVRIERGVSAGFVVFGVTATSLSLAVGNPLAQAVGPGYVPLCASLVLTVFAALETVRLSKHVAALPKSHEPVEPTAVKNRKSRGWLGFGLLAVSLLVWSAAGYLPGIFLATLSVFAADRRVPWRHALLFALLFAISLWLLFEFMLGTHLT